MFIYLLCHQKRPVLVKLEVRHKLTIFVLCFKVHEIIVYLLCHRKRLEYLVVRRLSAELVTEVSVAGLNKCMHPANLEQLQESCPMHLRNLHASSFGIPHFCNRSSRAFSGASLFDSASNTFSWPFSASPLCNEHSVLLHFHYNCRT